ncbi:beta-phosphoglucomutase family hydrolase [Vibrio superstes]|uniref:Carotenoid dehydrogenase n=1 Tax=Vibrio superstes NBRC 103154 TaxID=1219062 RepID=A0A511QVL0_9VIBR|nr:beta-phosphoglucomutase family hydrolase [Vibrio superstes]GEM81413.1 carotenoid dehydrogenase [Vibrio superstes NBRC 103154]
MLEWLDKYQGIIFDLDGTLIDSMPHHLDTWKTTADKFGFPYERVWLHSLGGMPGDKIVDLINERYQLALIPSVVSEFRMTVFNNLSSRGGLIECTNKVLEHFFGKKKLAVGTGSPRASAIQQLQIMGIYPKFDSIVTANDVDKHKPNPDTFLLAAKQINVEPTLCVVFEDTELGKLAAHNAQMDCIMLQGETLRFYPCN